MKIGDGEARWVGWLMKSMKGEAMEKIKANTFLKLSIYFFSSSFCACSNVWDN
jgi:hypothetical protein